MINWTTPTQPILLNTGLLEENQCEVYGTFAQNGHVLTLEPYHMTCDTDKDVSLVLFDMTQLETAGFKPGVMSVQVNIIDWMNYRAATLQKTTYFDPNSLREVLTHA